MTWTNPRAAALALALGVVACGCYSTTPHRAEIATPATTQVCERAVSDVFTNAGFIQLPPPPNVSMFFAPRTSGPYHSFLNSGSGVGVTYHRTEEAEGRCQVVLEALSPDIGCSSRDIDPYGAWGCHTTNTDGTSQLMTGASSTVHPCPIVTASSCSYSYAPGADNDAAVDELARRLQANLGTRARVN